MPVIDSHFAYLFGDLLMAGVWGILFFRRKDLRFEIFSMSLLSVFWVALSFTLFAPDILNKLWVPEGVGNVPFLPKGILLEDIFYTFLLGGIAAVLYEEILGKKHFKKYRREDGFMHYGIFPLIIFVSMLIGIRFFHINPYYASFFGFFLSAVVIWILREDLFWHSICSGFFLSIIYFIFFAFFFNPLFPGLVNKWWRISELSGILIMNVPIEEILWSFFFGILIGPSYEFILGLKDKK